MKIISLDMYLTLAIAAVALFVGLIIMQNIIAVGMSKILKVDPLVGMCTGSISMVVGHGVASAFNKTLALPLLILLIAQVVLIFVYVNLVVFNVMGRDYDAAVMVAGVCGFGLGATPNAMVNMNELMRIYKKSVKAYLLIPIIGGMFMDLANGGIIIFFISKIMGI